MKAELGAPIRGPTLLPLIVKRATETGLAYATDSYLMANWDVGITTFIR